MCLKRCPPETNVDSPEFWPPSTIENNSLNFPSVLPASDKGSRSDLKTEEQSTDPPNNPAKKARVSSESALPTYDIYVTFASHLGENYCYFVFLQIPDSLVQCENGFYLQDSSVCDGWVDCVDNHADDFTCK